MRTRKSDVRPFKFRIEFIKDIAVASWPHGPLVMLHRVASLNTNCICYHEFVEHPWNTPGSGSNEMHDQVCGFRRTAGNHGCWQQLRRFTASRLQLTRSRPHPPQQKAPIRQVVVRSGLTTRDGVQSLTRLLSSCSATASCCRNCIASEHHRRPPQVLPIASQGDGKHDIL